MSKDWADALGLAITPLFARDQAPAGDHYLLLDGIRGSFGMSQIPGQDIDADTRSWAWSTGVLHHVTATEHNVIIVAGIAPKRRDTEFQVSPTILIVYMVMF